MRRDPSALNGLGLGEVVDHYDAVVRGLDRPAGDHRTPSVDWSPNCCSIDRGLGAAGVAISPAPVKGVLRPPPAELRATFAVLAHPANRKWPRVKPFGTASMAPAITAERQVRSSRCCPAS
jgi:hypothetical protein